MYTTQMVENRFAAFSEDSFLAEHLCGRLVFWSLKSAGCPFDQLIERLVQEFGEDDSFPLPTIIASKAIRTAIKEYFSLPKRCKDIAVFRSEGRTFVYRSKDGDVANQPQDILEMHLLVEIDSRGPDIRLRGPEAEGFRPVLEAAMNTFTALNLSIWIPQVLQSYCSAIRLRETGGFYFVPRPMLDRLNKFVSVLDEVARVRFYRIPMIDTEEDVVDSVLEVTKEFLQKSLSEIRERIDRARKATPGHARNHYKRAIEESAELRKFLKLYEDTLKTNLTDLRKLIDAAYEDAERGLSGIDLAV